MKILSTLVILLVAGHCHAIENRDLYDIVVQGSVTLPRVDDESVKVVLQSPINFYTERYQEIYINTNGILTFTSEYPEFLNIQFPIEYPSISPFYSNIDTSNGDGSCKISYYQTTDTNLLNRASSVVREAYSDASGFRAKSLFVVTWSNVPKWKGESQVRAYEKNTFQVAVISNDDESYVEFLYPQGGIQWVQAETGASGLPDIRARAGFISSEGQVVTLKGSGTDKVRHLSETSNYGKPGRWLYRVGKLSLGENVEEPDNVPHEPENVQPRSCASGGRLQCHSSATCEDVSGGFCCKCKDGYYGNGLSCIRSDIPIRVTGSINGQVSATSIASQLQSYVVMVDGRAYTAVSALNGELGPKVQLLQAIGGIIGWLFAKPVGDTLNGYQITGGKFNHSANIHFDSGEKLTITQRYVGLNLWDQLAAEVEINGDVPEVHEGVKASMEDFFEEFNAGTGTISSVSTHKIQLSSGEPDIGYTIHQNIYFEKCPFLDQSELARKINGRLKTSKIQLGYYSQENAVRISTVTKIGVSDTTNPCLEGTARCGENTICVPTGDDSYECQCQNGFTFSGPSHDGDHTESCVDIDECRRGHICSEHAECYNRNGGYDCICLPGYEGNGFDCHPVSHHVSTPYYNQPIENCRDCSENAYCSEGVCVCNHGFFGNGHDCRMICALNEVFNGVSCVKIATAEEDEIAAYCTEAGCICPRGYKLIEYSIKSVCQPIESIDDDDQQPGSCDVHNNCHPFANCEFDKNIYRYQCVCGPGYDGNGIDCIEIPENCVDADICDAHADCVYNATLRKSVCVCYEGYEGNGRVCNVVAECKNSADCGYHSICNQGVCECENGYERDSSDLCVLAGSCNGAFCAENAYCRFNERNRVNYCHCPEGYVGDGVIECKSLPPPCNVRNNCGLYATCMPNYKTSTYECVCNDGYNGDGFVCVLERNCHNMPDLCDYNAQCSRTSAGWKCVCNQGFVGNGTTCKEPPKLETGFLIVSQGVAAVKIPLSSLKRGTPVTTAGMLIGVDKDCAEGRVYWSDISGKTISSAKYDGSDKKVFINTDIISPEGIAIDWVSRRLYWTDSGKDTIEVASLDNSTLRSVLINRGLVNPRGIAVDPQQGKVFWSDWNRVEPKIEWANLDGSDRHVLVSSPQIKLPNSLALSMSSGELCYADASDVNPKIECIDTYSKNTRVIASGLSYPFGLAITDEAFYWSDWKTMKIESVDLNGVRQTAIQPSMFRTHKMYGMTAVTDRCPIDFSTCNVNNGDCPNNHICLVNPRSPLGRTCKCLTHADCNIYDIDGL